MAIKIVDSFAKRKVSDALILPFFEGKIPAFTHKGMAALYEAPLKAGDFNGEKETVLCHYSSEGEKRLILVGLGKEKDLSKETLRRAYANAIGSIKSKVKSVNVQVPSSAVLNSAEVSEAVTEGVLLTNYVYNVNKTEKDKAIDEFSFIGGDVKAIRRSETICNSVCYTRDLVFANADTVTPMFLAEKAKELAAEFSSIKTTVLGREHIKKQKLGLIEAVGRGSDREQALIILEYNGNPKSTDQIALIAKGLALTQVDLI